MCPEISTRAVSVEGWERQLDGRGRKGVRGAEVEAVSGDEAFKEFCFTKGKGGGG